MDFRDTVFVVQDVSVEEPIGDLDEGECQPRTDFAQTDHTPRGLAAHTVARAGVALHRDVKHMRW